MFTKGEGDLITPLILKVDP